MYVYDVQYSNIFLFSVNIAWVAWYMYKYMVFSGLNFLAAPDNIVIVPYSSQQHRVVNTQPEMKHLHPEIRTSGPEYNIFLLGTSKHQTSKDASLWKLTYGHDYEHEQKQLLHICDCLIVRALQCIFYFSCFYVHWCLSSISLPCNLEWCIYKLPYEHHVFL